MLDRELNNAMQVISNLSRDAKADGDRLTMYAANRAWHELNDARCERVRRALALTNGDRASG